MYLKGLQDQVLGGGVELLAQASPRRIGVGAQAGRPVADDQHADRAGASRPTSATTRTRSRGWSASSA